MRKWLVFYLFIVVISCSKDNDISEENPISSNECTKIGQESGFVFYEDGQKWLWGGENEDWHFNISNWSLKECQLHYGQGRESFKALIEPNYTTISEVDHSLEDQDRVIILIAQDYIKAYPLDILITHEVVNETVDDNPVAIVFCHLANLAAVYSRSYCNNEFTFALSGYTYYDNNIWDGLDGFVLWDRETESLWWPLIDEGVSGKMQGTTLIKYNSSRWFETTWKDVKENYPNANVLKPGQDMEIPSDWESYHSLDC